VQLNYEQNDKSTGHDPRVMLAGVGTRWLTALNFNGQLPGPPEIITASAKKHQQRQNASVTTHQRRRELKG
jgi:hypothetical protein